MKRNKYKYKYKKNINIKGNINIKRHTKSYLGSKRTYFAAISLFRNKLLSRTTKILLYKTLIRPIVAYGAETWTMTKKEEHVVLDFERKIFRRIYGAKYEDGEWKCRTNREP
jgi:hypothetical protein